MLEDLVGALVRSQVGDFRRRTAGALLEVAAVAMLGLAVTLVFVGLFIWLSGRMEAWLAAFVLGLLALAVALALMLLGRSLRRRNEERRQREALSGLEALELVLRPGKDGEDRKDPGPALVGAALAAGVLLGRSMKR